MQNNWAVLQQEPQQQKVKIYLQQPDPSDANNF
jgi:hypothetical protein